MKEKAYKMKCLHPECEKQGHSRGLCLSCYMGARKLVASGKTTWGDLEQQGKCNKSTRMTKSKWFLK